MKQFLVHAITKLVQVVTVPEDAELMCITQNDEQPVSFDVHFIHSVPDAFSAIREVSYRFIILMNGNRFEPDETGEYITTLIRGNDAYHVFARMLK